MKITGLGLVSLKTKHSVLFFLYFKSNQWADQRTRWKNSLLKLFEFTLTDDKTGVEDLPVLNIFSCWSDQKVVRSNPNTTWLMSVLHGVFSKIQVLSLFMNLVLKIKTHALRVSILYRFTFWHVIKVLFHSALLCKSLTSDSLCMKCTVTVKPSSSARRTLLTADQIFLKKSFFVNPVCFHVNMLLYSSCSWKAGAFAALVF